MKKLLLISGVISISALIHAQSPNWSEDIAPMVYENCSKCHHPGTAAPFSLMSYEDVVDNSLNAYFNMEEGWMPPWPANTDFRHFVGEPTVTDEQIDEFLEWIEAGHPFGDPDLEPEAPVFTDGVSLLDQVDFVAAIEPYTLQYNYDETRWFVIETNFSETKYINGIEVFAGLDLVHHADISIDNTSQSANFDALDPLPGFNSQTGSPYYSSYMNAWQPGAGPMLYPEGWGFALNPGDDLVIEIHYGPGGAEEIDETYMNIKFVEDPVNVRQVNVGWLLGSGNMTDGPLVVPPNVQSVFHQEATPFNSDKSLISICPHMHLIGKSYKIWMQMPDGANMPLVYVDNWDFHWQFYYTYPYLQKIPAGATLYSEAVYDNTSTSPYNPNDPPQQISWGPNTTDEMMLTFFTYANYQPGDEYISMDPALSMDEIPDEKDWRIFPNPARDQINIISQKNTNEPGMFRVVDLLGNVAMSLDAGVPNPTYQIDISTLKPGAYFLEWFNSKNASSRQFIKLE